MLLWNSIKRHVRHANEKRQWNEDEMQSDNEMFGPRNEIETTDKKRPTKVKKNETKEKRINGEEWQVNDKGQARTRSERMLIESDAKLQLKVA